MSKTISFYNIFLEKGDELINVSVKNFIDFVLEKTRENRQVKIEEYPIILEKLKRNEEDIYRLRFEKYRDKFKPYIGTIEDGITGQIPDTVIENTCFLFDPGTNVLGLEFSIEGIREGKVITYLNSFLKNDYKIVLKPIRSDVTLADVKATEKIKKIHIELKLNSKNKQIFLENSDRIEDNFIIKLIKGIQFDKVSTDIGASSFGVSFSVGRQDSTLTTTALIELLDVFNLKSDFIKSIKLEFEKGDKFVPINLKSLEKTYKIKILTGEHDKNPGYEYLLDNLAKEYKENQQIKLSTKKNEYRLVHSDCDIKNIFK